MDYLGVLYFSLPIVLIYWVKNNTEINIRRVLILSFIPLFILSVITYLYTAFSTGRWLNSLNLIILMNLFGYIFYYPILIVSALVVKYFQKRDTSVLVSALLGSLMGVFLTSIPAVKYDFSFLLIVFSSGFVSVFIEDKIFKGDK